MGRWQAEGGPTAGRGWAEGRHGGRQVGCGAKAGRGGAKAGRGGAKAGRVLGWGRRQTQED